MATATKTCPGARFAKVQLTPAHDAKANTDVFAKNAARKDGLSRVCKACWKVYEAKRRQAAGATSNGTAPAEAKPKAPKGPQFHDRQAAKAHAGKIEGWGSSTIGGVIYARPTGKEQVASEGGQAALATIQTAQAAARKSRGKAKADVPADQAAPADNVADAQAAPDEAPAATDDAATASTDAQAAPAE